MTQQRLELTWFNKNRALIPNDSGHYGYSWVDPKDPRYCEVHTLIYDDVVTGKRAVKEDDQPYGPRAELEPQSDNLLITGESGDALEALRYVPELRDKYEGKIKCVYIDPPFNTAQVFGNYEDNLEHSIWLTMMRDRLGHLSRLLSDDGSIWVHLDDVEDHRMRVLLDEVFGAGRFVAAIQWEKLYARKSNNDAFSSNNDTILVYRKADSAFNRLEAGASLSARYSNRDNDERGAWQSVSFSVRTDDPAKRGDYRYEVELPSGRRVGPPEGRHWNGKIDRYQRLKEEGKLWFGAEGDSRPREKKFLDRNVAPELIPFTIWPREEVGDNDEAKKGLRSLLPEVSDTFSTPKPERLLERVLHIATDPGDIVLDVFAGSGTTAAVAQKMGRRWVTCELLDETVSTYTRPRLEKVVRGEDPGGITTVPGERVAAYGVELPDGMSPNDAQTLTSLLTKATKDDPDLGGTKNPLAEALIEKAATLPEAEAKAVKRALRAVLREQPDLKKSVVAEVKARVKTRKTKDALNWLGGGGFSTAHLSPSVFDYDPELDVVTLTDAARDYDTLVASVAAQLRFYLTPEDDYFQGRLGSQRLAVLDTVVTAGTVEDFAAHLAEGEGLILAATAIDETARGAMRRLVKGGRVLHVPSDLFSRPVRDTKRRK